MLVQNLLICARPLIQATLCTDEILVRLTIPSTFYSSNQVEYVQVKRTKTMLNSTILLCLLFIHGRTKHCLLEVRAVLLSSPVCLDFNHSCIAVIPKQATILEASTVSIVPSGSHGYASSSLSNSFLFLGCELFRLPFWVNLARSTSGVTDDVKYPGQYEGDLHAEPCST